MDKIFPTLIGNATLKRNVGADIRAHRNSHAYIIEGKHGSGKHTAAHLIASALSCEHRDDASFPLPCGECSNCNKIKKGISPDVVTVGTGGKASIGVDEIRLLREGLYVSPNDSDTRTYIIEEAERLTAQAQNALLRTIEEPPSFAVFLLLTEDSSRILETVKSRAQRIRTESFSPSRVGEYLNTVPTLRQRSEKDKLAAASLSGGSLGRACELLSGDGTQLNAMRSDAARLITALADAQRAPLLRMLPEITKKGAEPKRLLALADNALRDLCCLKSGCEISDGMLEFFVTADEAEALLTKYPYKKLIFIHDRICEALAMLDANASVKTVFTSLIIECHSHRR